jgi:hypothetical protein
MSGGVGSRVGGGVAMVEELGECCLRQPRIGACGRAVRKAKQKEG